MIGYLPEIYQDELLYSWVARYYCHSGYSGYVSAIEDFLENRYSKINYEFFGKLNKSAEEIIKQTYDYKDLLINHTMLPYYARFADKEKKNKAVQLLMEGKSVTDALTFQTSKEPRHIMYCPLCAREDRETYGETYFHRTHQIRNIKVCPIHGIYLKSTSILIAAKTSPRLFVPEEEIPYEEQCSNGTEKEVAFAKYMEEVFNADLDFETCISISDFLNSRLEGTPYISKRGKRRYTAELSSAMQKFYHTDIEQHVISKLFIGSHINIHVIMQVAFFLNISAHDLTHPMLPELSQVDRFNKSVAELNGNGLGSHRIGSILGVSSQTALKANRKIAKAPHDYSVRKGMHKQDWSIVDKESLPMVKKAIHNLYGSTSVKPKKITEYAVIKALGFPDKRFDYLPLCKAEIEKHKETQEQYWAREVVWAYRHVCDSFYAEQICWRRIREITNMRRRDFDSILPLLEDYTDISTADKIRML